MIETTPFFPGLSPVSAKAFQIRLIFLVPRRNVRRAGSTHSRQSQDIPLANPRDIHAIRGSGLSSR